MQVAVQAACRAEARDPPVRRVEHEPRAVAQAVYVLAFPPRQDRLAVELLHLEVRDCLVDHRMEPNETAGVVEDHRTVLPGT